MGIDSPTPNSPPPAEGRRCPQHFLVRRQNDRYDGAPASALYLFAKQAGRRVGFADGSRLGEIGVNSGCVPEADDSIASLIREARAGSQEALGALLERYRDYLLLVAQTELGSDLRGKAGASDLVQETFLDAQRDYSKFRGDDRAELLRWLREILQNNLSDLVRRYRTAARAVSQERPLESADYESVCTILPFDVASPQAIFLGRERQRLLHSAIERLPRDYCQVVMLRHVKGHSWQETAAAMNRSVGAVQKLWMRALEQLRRQLQRE